MGGKVLELESDRLIRQGMERGIAIEKENMEQALKKVREAEKEIRRLKQLFAEMEKH